MDNSSQPAVRSSPVASSVRDNEVDYRNGIRQVLYRDMYKK